MGDPGVSAKRDGVIIMSNHLTVLELDAQLKIE